MSKHITYKTKGVCAQQIDFDLEDGILKNVKFTGGCRGNTQGVAALANNRPAAEVAALCKGLVCRPDGNSCPNQLALAIEEALAIA